MHFSQFQNQLNHTIAESDVINQTQCYGQLIQETSDGAILVDRKLTCFLSLEEARQSIKYNKIKEDIEEEIHKELYENISDTKIAELIHEYHNVKVTDKLIESYVHLASSKIFTSDPVVKDIRNFNITDRLIESKIDFVLDDGTQIAIDEETYNRINNIFAEHTDVIQYMRQSTDNFLSVIDQLGD